MKCVETIDWTASAAWAQAAFAMLAIGAAISAPYIAAGIDRSRRRLAARKLAELTVDAMKMAGFDLGLWLEPMPRAETHRAVATLHLPALIDRMERMPTSDIEDAVALEAYIRISGAARFVQEMMEGTEPPPVEGYRVDRIATAVQLADNDLKLLRAWLP